MKKLILSTFVFLGLLLTAFVLYVWNQERTSLKWEDVQAYNADKIPVEPKDFRNDFEEMFNVIKDKYAYKDTKHLNLDSIHTACLQRLDTMQSKVAYSLLIKELFSSLKCAHANNVSIEEP